MNKEVGGLWKVRTKLEKYHEDIAPFKGREHVFHERYTPYEVGRAGRQLPLNEGINNMWTLICGRPRLRQHERTARRRRLGHGWRLPRRPTCKPRRTKPMGLWKAVPDLRHQPERHIQGVRHRHGELHLERMERG